MAMSIYGEIPTQEPDKRKKGCYIGAPAVFALELACKPLWRAFCQDDDGIYLVGSCLEHADWRDVDVRCILDDEAFRQLFPDAGDNWEQDDRWLVMTTAISQQLSATTGLLVDFQFQPRTHANDCFGKRPRSAIGLHRG